VSESDLILILKQLWQLFLAVLLVATVVGGVRLFWIKWRIQTGKYWRSVEEPRRFKDDD
jgi:hypothetical protein